jgi:hypothetical protein
VINNRASEQYLECWTVWLITGHQNSIWNAGLSPPDLVTRQPREMWATSRYPVYVPACRPRLIDGRAKGTPKSRPDGTKFVLLRTSSFQQHHHQLLPTTDGAFHAGKKCDLPGRALPPGQAQWHALSGSRAGFAGYH